MDDVLGRGDVACDKTFEKSNLSSLHTEGKLSDHG